MGRSVTTDGGLFKFPMISGRVPRVCYRRTFFYLFVPFFLKFLHRGVGLLVGKCFSIFVSSVVLCPLRTQPDLCHCMSCNAINVNSAQRKLEYLCPTKDSLYHRADVDLVPLLVKRNVSSFENLFCVTSIAVGELVCGQCKKKTGTGCPWLVAGMVLENMLSLLSPSGDVDGIVTSLRCPFLVFSYIESAICTTETVALEKNPNYIGLLNHVIQGDPIHHEYTQFLQSRL